MPPLNHRCDVERTGTVFSVDVQECNTNAGGDSPHTRDTHFVESYEAAVVVALCEIDGDPKVTRMSTGMTYFYEPHDDEEAHTRACIRERRVFSHS